MLLRHILHISITTITITMQYRPQHIMNLATNKIVEGNSCIFLRVIMYSRTRCGIAYRDTYLPFYLMVCRHRSQPCLLLIVSPWWAAISSSCLFPDNIVTRPVVVLSLLLCELESLTFLMSNPVFSPTRVLGYKHLRCRARMHLPRIPGM